MGRRARIDRARVVSGALALADEEGLEALTMARVAERLGVTPMALYRHVAGKAGLLDGVVELLLTEFPPPPEALSWPERLNVLAGNIRASAHRHPAVFPLVLHLPANTPEARRTRESVYRALKDAGVTEARVAQIERLVSTAVLGFAVSEAAGRFRHHSRHELDADFGAMQALLRRFIEQSAASN